MQKRQFKFVSLLAEHTLLRPHPATWFSCSIRVLCCSRYSHYSILMIDELDGSFHMIESTWPKVKVKTYQEWYAHSDRLVLPQFLDEAIWPFDLEAVLAKEGEKYPVRDIVEQPLDIARTCWFAIGHRWNGFSGIGRGGTFCTELAATGMGRADSHRIRPNDLYSPLGIVGVINGEEFRTYKGQQAAMPEFLLQAV
ncbi:hypothetical protein [uncultured Pontibacter sp.]|uniref:hypothetical protein n=1 Tax=uncultured Pontibacter sp. TaxID=453356 RepID=UPI0026269994|nr:hypothetical protein [uncultured Pontibacter sp.]